MLPGLTTITPVFSHTTHGYIVGGYSYSTYKGIDVLRWGMIGAVYSIFAWYANPLTWLALFFGTLRFRKTALVLATLASIIGLQAFAVRMIPTGFSTNVDCGPIDVQLHNLQCISLDFSIGFYIWLLSILLLVIYCGMLLQLSRSSNPTSIHSVIIGSDSK